MKVKVAITDAIAVFFIPLPGIEAAMKTWSEVKTQYHSYLSRAGLKQPQRRLSALNKIEEYLKATHPSAFKGHALFATINKGELKQKFENWKGKNISGAESQVINDFYNLATLSNFQN